MEADTPTLSDEELTQLKYEVFTKEVSRIVSSSEKPAPKPVWLRFLESSGGTAMITVLVGGLVGSILTGLFQYLSQERERNVAAYEKSLEKKQIAIDTIYKLLGATLARADNMVSFKIAPGNSATTTQNQMQIRRINDEEKTLSDRYAEAKENWQAHRMEPLLLVALNFPNNSDIMNSWRKVDISLSEYLTVAQNCWDFKDICKNAESKKTTVDTSIEDFILRLSGSRLSLDHWAVQLEKDATLIEALVSKSRFEGLFNNLVIVLMRKSEAEPAAFRLFSLYSTELEADKGTDHAHKNWKELKYDEKSKDSASTEDINKVCKSLAPSEDGKYYVCTNY